MGLWWVVARIRMVTNTVLEASAQKSLKIISQGTVAPSQKAKHRALQYLAYIVMQVKLQCQGQK